MRSRHLPLTLFLLLGAPLQPAVAAPGTAAARAKTPTATLIARYVAWRGGKAYERLRSYHVVADAKGDGLKGVSAEWHTRNGYVRDEFDLGAVKGLSIRTPTAGWEKNGGLVSPVGSFSLNDARRALAIEFGDALRGKAGSTPSRLPDEVIDGKNRAVLRISFGDADTYDLIVNPDSGALYGQRYTVAGHSSLVRRSDWRFVHGVRFDFKREYLQSDGKVASTEIVHSLDINRKMDAKLFERPLSEQSLSFASGSHGTGPIKYNDFGGSRIYIPAKVNGTEVEVLLDSGADSTVIDQEFARKAGIKKVGSTKAITAGEANEQGFANNVKIQIGSMSLAPPTVNVGDLASVGQRIGIPLPVILGRDVFLQSVVDINSADKTITFHDSSTFVPPSGATLVPLEPLDSLWVVPASVEGLPPAPMLFDLGNGSTIFLNASFWRKHKLLDGRKSVVAGGSQARLSTLSALEFAGVKFHDIPAIFLAPTDETEGERRAGNIGLPLLKRFRLMIDFQNKRLFVIPLAERIAAPFDRDRSGLSLRQEGSKLTVGAVTEGSPAAAAGFKAGDVVTAIDGQAIPSDYARSELKSWGRKPAGTAVTLTMGDGSIRHLTLEDYF